MEPGSISSPSPEARVNTTAEKQGGVKAESSQQTAPEFAVAQEREQQAPQSTIQQQVAQVASMPALPTAQASAASTIKPQDDNPLIAADEDLVEKEWVDKAKKIVAQTKDDPYAQEKEVSRLQADYLKKRYGKELKVSGE